MGSRCHRLLFASLSLCNKTNFSLLFFIFAPHWKNLRQAFAGFLPCVYTLHCTPWSKLYWEQETNWDTARQSSSMAMLCMAEQLSLHSLHDADTCTWCALGFYKCLKSFYSSSQGWKGAEAGQGTAVSKRTQQSWAAKEQQWKTCSQNYSYLATMHQADCKSKILGVLHAWSYRSGQLVVVKFWKSWPCCEAFWPIVQQNSSRSHIKKVSGSDLCK